jgi:hypothetical protein
MLEFKGKGPLKKGVLMLEDGKIVRVGETFDPKKVDEGVLEDLKAMKPPAVGKPAKAVGKGEDGKKGGK